MLRVLVRTGVIFLWIGLAVVAAGPGQAELRRLEGDVSYLMRIALPRDATIEVKLLDMSGADAASVGLAAIVIRPEGQVPVPFALLYDDALVNDGHRYGIQATLRAQGQILYHSTLEVPDLRRGAPERVAVLIEPVPQQGGMTDLIGTEWIASAIDRSALNRAQPPTIGFSRRGTITGFSSCNNYTAPIQISGEGLELGPIAATKKACLPPLVDQEHAYYTALESAVRFDLSGSTLILINAEGRMVLTFQAK